MQREFENNQASLKELFLRFDLNKAGVLNKEDFCNIMKQFINRDSIVNKVFDIFDKNQTGLVNYIEFMNTIFCFDRDDKSQQTKIKEDLLEHL